MQSRRRRGGVALPDASQIRGIRIGPHPELVSRAWHWLMLRTITDMPPRFAARICETTTMIDLQIRMFEDSAIVKDVFGGMSSISDCIHD
jgi:hypothetical protein